MTLLDSAELRAVLGRFPTGVTVITTVDADGAPVGCTVSAFSSLSLDPPLVLFCIGRDRHSHRHIVHGAGFAVNILRHDQATTALTFARFDPDRFERVPYQAGRHGIPLLSDCVAQIECDTERIEDGGDHSIVIGRVTALHVSSGEPLIYSQGSFLDLSSEAWDRSLADAPHEWLLSAPW